MRAPHIARRYAKALLEIGSETGKLDPLVREMLSLDRGRMNGRTT